MLFAPLGRASPDSSRRSRCRLARPTTGPCCPWNLGLRGATWPRPRVERTAEECCAGVRRRGVRRPRSTGSGRCGRGDVDRERAHAVTIDRRALSRSAMSSTLGPSRLPALDVGLGEIADDCAPLPREGVWPMEQFAPLDGDAAAAHSLGVLRWVLGLLVAARSWSTCVWRLARSARSSSRCSWKLVRRSVRRCSPWLRSGSSSAQAASRSARAVASPARSSPICSRSSSTWLRAVSTCSRVPSVPCAWAATVLAGGPAASYVLLRGDLAVDVLHHVVDFGSSRLAIRDTC